MWTPQKKLSFCTGPFNYKKGALIIGVASMLLSFFSLIIGLFYLQIPLYKYEHLCKDVINKRPTHTINVTQCVKFVYIVIGIDVILSMIDIFFSIVLMIGIRELKPKLMIPFLVFQFLILGLASPIVFFVLYLSGKVVSLYTSMIILIFFTISIICYTIVFSAYKEIKTEISNDDKRSITTSTSTIIVGCSRNGKIDDDEKIDDSNSYQYIKQDNCLKEINTNNNINQFCNLYNDDYILKEEM